MSWTPERVDELKKLWAEGLSATAIGIKMGITRNACIGKVHRLGMSGRKSSRLYNRPPPRKQEKKSAPKKAGRQRKQPSTVQQILLTPEPLPPTPEMDVPHVSLADREDHQCSWPVGDPKQPGFGFCGCDRVPGLPYCEHHVRRAYAPKGDISSVRPAASARGLIKSEASALEGIKEFAS